MKTASIGAIIIILIAVFFIVPMAVGGSTNACQALAKHNVSNTASIKLAPVVFMTNVITSPCSPQPKQWK